MLHRPEPTKERVEPTILSIIANEITLLKLALCYCCYEVNLICDVLTSPHGCILITVAGIRI